MNPEIDSWWALALRLGVTVTAPASVFVGDEIVTFTALLPQFGARNGMIVDRDWGLIDPHSAALLKLGYGFSAVEIGTDDDDESAQEMLRDWGWSSSEPTHQWW